MLIISDMKLFFLFDVFCLFVVERVVKLYLFSILQFRMKSDQTL